MTWHRSVCSVGAVVVVSLTLAGPNVGNGQGLDSDNRSWNLDPPTSLDEEGHARWQGSIDLMTCRYC